MMRSRPKPTRSWLACGPATCPATAPGPPTRFRCLRRGSPKASSRNFEDRQMSDQTTLDDRIEIKGRGGTFNAYVAQAGTLPAPAVVVLHEVFGVNADI